MELMSAQTQQSYCRNRNKLCSPLNLAVTSLKKKVHKINELCNLPDLEITPVTKTMNKKSITESNERSTSLEAETSRENNLKEKSDMENLLKRLPILNEYFHLHNKIGEGTFSTVYLATLKNSDSTKNYAVKHLTQNCQQLTIEGEFRCMTEIGGKDNVVHADCCLTSGDDCVTFIMPYLPHKKFSDYVLEMDADETRLYMQNLFIALRRVHSFNIIHRDVKPGNFLYNRENKEFLLVDFGLAQVVQNHCSDGKKESIPVDENMPIDYSKKHKRKESIDEEKSTPAKRSKRVALKSNANNINMSQIRDNCGNKDFFNRNMSFPVAQSENRELKSPMKQFPNKGSTEKTPLKSKVLNSANCPPSRRKKLFDECSPEGNAGLSKNAAESNQFSSMVNVEMEGRGANSASNGPLRERKFASLISSKFSSENVFPLRNSKVFHQCEPMKSKPTDTVQKPKSKTPCINERCTCSGRGAICASCSLRNKMVAPRAGTPGFRPPEVLLKYLNQTTAVDMWASGVILLCILSGCYPFFKSPNDLAALAEIMTVFGTEPVTKIAAKFGRRVVCSDQKKGINLKKLCKLLRARTTKKAPPEKKSPNDVICNDCFQPIKNDGCLCNSENAMEQSRSKSDSDYGFPDSAFDLLKRLLDLDPTTRITASEALEHPFILGH